MNVNIINKLFSSIVCFFHFRITNMVPKHHSLKLRLTDAIIDLCRKEAFYIEELRIEGTVCLVSDRSSVLIAQITEQIGNQESNEPRDLPQLNKDHASKSSQDHDDSVLKIQDNDKEPKDMGSRNIRTRYLKKGHRNKYQCPFCSKSYAFKHSMRDHMNVHMGRKPHACKLCPMSFSHLGSMCGHMKREHIHSLKQLHNNCNLTASQCECNRSQCQSKTMEASLNSHSPTRTQSDKPMDMGHLPLPTADSLENIKQELGSAGNVPPREGGAAEKESESIMDVKSFLQQFESDKDQQAEHSQLGALTSQNQRLTEGHLQGHQAGLTPVTTLTPELIHTLNMSQAAGQSGALRWDNPLAAVTGVNANMTPVSVSLTPQAQGMPGLPNPTLEMLAHMAQITQNPQFPASVSELSQVLSAQQRSITTTTCTVPRLRMPSPASLQRSPDGKFQCPFCEKTYNFKHTLKDHINKHMGNRPHVCKHCGDSFTHLASLCAHIKRRHDSQMTSDYQCELCHEKFMNLQSLKQHFTWRHKDVKFSPQKFLESSRGVVGPEGDTPIKSSRQQLQQQTPLSGASSQTYSSLSNSPPKLLSTNTSVSSSFSSSMSCSPLTSPTSSSTGGLTPQNLTSPLTPNLLSPMSTESTNVRLADQCLFPPNSTISPKNENLSEKLNENQSAAATLSNQPQFPGVFVYPSNPGCHDNTPGQDEVVASPLTRSSSEEESLSFTTHIADYFSEVNLQTEQGLYKYKCKICGNLFKIRNSLYEHLNSHLGKKPYVCGVCGDAFTHHSSLHNHTRNKHSQQSRQEREAQFRHCCGVCSKKFRFPSELDRHFKTNPDHDIRQTPPSMA